MLVQDASQAIKIVKGCVEHAIYLGGPTDP